MSIRQCSKTELKFYEAISNVTNLVEFIKSKKKIRTDRQKSKTRMKILVVLDLH